MKAKGWLTDAEAASIQAEMTDLVAEAETFARESPFPAPEEALENVFA
jgi:TPP-dependent pyruvate/acetoin dehydrogenase alpha subunit